MESGQIKKSIHSYVDMIEDKTQLQMLNEAVEAFATKPPDVIEQLTGEQLNRLEESIRQANEGKLTSHEEVLKLSKQWLTK